MSQQLCKRCGDPFEPVLFDAINRMSTCCELCSFRNLTEACGLPTPPELLDPYSKVLTLTEWDYQKKLKKHTQHRPVVALGYQAEDGTITVTDVLCMNFPDMTNEQMADLSRKLDDWSNFMRAS